MRNADSRQRFPTWAWLLFAGIGLIGVLGLLLGLAAMFGIGGFGRVGKLLMGDGGTVDPPGDPRAFDPVARFPDVATYAGTGVVLLRMRASQVRSDGLLDLTVDYRPSPNARYEFVREVPAPANAPPLGAGAPADGRWHQLIVVDLGKPGVMRYQRKVSGNSITERNYVARGMEKREDDPTGARVEAGVVPPACPLQRLWRQAIAQGVPENAVASIDYDADGYDFSVRDTRWSLHFGPDCTLQPQG